MISTDFTAGSRDRRGIPLCVRKRNASPAKVVCHLNFLKALVSQTLITLFNPSNILIDSSGRFIDHTLQPCASTDVCTLKILISVPQIFVSNGLLKEGLLDSCEPSEN